MVYKSLIPITNFPISLSIYHHIQSLTNKNILYILLLLYYYPHTSPASVKVNANFSFSLVPASLPPIDAPLHAAATVTKYECFQNAFSLSCLTTASPLPRPPSPFSNPHFHPPFFYHKHCSIPSHPISSTRISHELASRQLPSYIIPSPSSPHPLFQDTSGSFSPSVQCPFVFPLPTSHWVSRLSPPYWPMALRDLRLPMYILIIHRSQTPSLL